MKISRYKNGFHWIQPPPLIIIILKPPKTNNYEFNYCTGSCRCQMKFAFISLVLLPATFQIISKYLILYVLCIWLSNHRLRNTNKNKWRGNLCLRPDTNFLQSHFRHKMSHLTTFIHNTTSGNLEVEAFEKLTLLIKLINPRKVNLAWEWHDPPRRTGWRPGPWGTSPPHERLVGPQWWPTRPATGLACNLQHENSVKKRTFYTINHGLLNIY